MKRHQSSSAINNHWNDNTNKKVKDTWRLDLKDTTDSTNKKSHKTKIFHWTKVANLCQTSKKKQKGGNFKNSNEAMKILDLKASSETNLCSRCIEQSDTLPKGLKSNNQKYKTSLNRKP